MRKQILGLALRYQGEWEKITEGLKQGEKPPCSEIAAPYVTWADAEYPALLRQLRFPPWILFYQGNLALADLPATGIVGSRRACRYGLTMTERCCGALKDEVIVSGLALGIDGAAHRAALRLCRGTIGIAGCGLDGPIRRITVIYIQNCRKPTAAERISASDAAPEASLSVAQPADRRAERPDRRHAGGISQRHDADGQRSDRAEPGGLVSALSRNE